MSDSLMGLSPKTLLCQRRMLPVWAVLAALNFADELEQLKEKFAAERGGLPREFAARVEACARQLESALGGELGR